MKCITCKEEIVDDWRKDRVVRKTKPLLYCSRNCANNRGVRSEATKLKISRSLKGRKRNIPGSPGYRPRTYIDCVCVTCGDTFIAQAGYEKKTCSKVCASYLRSINRQNYLKEHGNFSTLRETFNYKDVVIDVDSNLEKAGIVYLIDELGANRIERFISILNYWEDGSHRTFNPDFICRIDSKTCIVEVKQKWNIQSEHPYNRTIPYKQLALEKYCDDKGYKMLWLDFNTAPVLKTIYKRILNERQSQASIGALT